MKIDTVIGDTAYSEKNNIQYASRNELQLVAKLNPNITQGTRKKKKNLSSIKMLECMYVTQDIWRFAKRAQEKRCQ